MFNWCVHLNVSGGNIRVQVVVTAFSIKKTCDFQRLFLFFKCHILAIGFFTFIPCILHVSMFITVILRSLRGLNWSFVGVEGAPSPGKSHDLYSDSRSINKSIVRHPSQFDAEMITFRGVQAVISDLATFPLTSIQIACNAHPILFLDTKLDMFTEKLDKNEIYFSILS